MNKNKFIQAFLSVLIVFGTACDSFLDTVPDARPELTDPKKVSYLLNSAYSGYFPIVATEMASDNIDWVDDVSYKYYYLAQEESYFWKDVRDDGGNDALVDVYPELYMAIAAANQALIAIEEQGTPENMLPLKGEALLARAYSHFILVNVFGQHYNPQTSETDLGVVYMDRAETELNPKYERESVAEVYRKIEKDIEEGLPLIDDGVYTYPKYHFNVKAAHAFAARFNLFYGKWDKAVEYATKAIGEHPETMMRNWASYTTIGTDNTAVPLYYTSLDQNCNLMLITAVSSVRNYYAGYYRKYQHTKQVADYEVERGPGPWGPARGNSSPRTFWMVCSSYAGNCVFWKNIPIKMKYESPTATSGVNHTTLTAFTTEETLLVRAEAYAIKGEFDKSADDLALWMKVMVRTDAASVGQSNVLTRDKINSYYGGLDYYTPIQPTPKKHLHPLLFDLTEGSELENFLHCVLHFRRIETVHQGQRWYDVKRYGIEIYRRIVHVDGTVGSKGIIELTDSLKLNDNRRAFQLPPSVIAAGLEANPGVYRK
ncbi:MAG: RagB/SusD family nutrient uptake outer membrane protein [Tannerella sp.]|nr:RagB/SusD family nutrient uptake outer membrane protein [Tannerella sp.]